MEEILYYASYILETIFETYVLARLMQLFLETRPERKNYLMGACVLRVILCTVQYMYYPYTALNLIMSIGTLVLIVYGYDGRSAKKLTVVFICCTCQITSEAVVAVILSVSKNNIDWKSDEHNGDAFTYISIAVALWIICEIVRSFQNIHKEIMVPRLFSGSIILLSSIMYVLECAIFLGDTLTEFIRLLSAVCLLLVLFLIIYLYDSLSKNYMDRIQNEIIEREKSYYYKQAELLQRSSRELSDFRHDSMNHLYALSSMLKDSDIEAKRYMEKLIGKMQDVKTYSNTGNIAVDSVINYKLSEAEYKKIEVKAQILLPRQMCFESQDIIAILGNLLDNAIEAAEKVKKRKYLYIDMKYKAGSIFIFVKNSYDGLLNMRNGEIITRKEDAGHHGIGLKSVRSTVESHDGTMNIEHGNQEFIVKIMMYI